MAFQEIVSRRRGNLIPRTRFSLLLGCQCAQLRRTANAVVRAAELLVLGVLRLDGSLELLVCVMSGGGNLRVLQTWPAIIIAELLSLAKILMSQRSRTDGWL